MSNKCKKKALLVGEMKVPSSLQRLERRGESPKDWGEVRFVEGSRCKGRHQTSPAYIALAIEVIGNTKIFRVATKGKHRIPSEFGETQVQLPPDQNRFVEGSCCKGQYQTPGGFTQNSFNIHVLFILSK